MEKRKIKARQIPETEQSSQDNNELAHKYYVEGAEAWRNGDRKRAMTLYSMSANLNPDGPGAQALKMTEDIMSFFDPNQLNP